MYDFTHAVFCALVTLADVMVLLLYFAHMFIFKNLFCAEYPFLKAGVHFTKNMTIPETYGN